MNRRLVYALAAAATAATLALTGCGGADTSTGSKPQGSALPSAASPSATDQPTTAASPTTASTPSEETSASTGSADDGAKPAKSDVVAGLATFYVQTQGISGGKAKKFAECMVGEMYDKAKPATLVAMRDGDPTKIDKSDVGLLTQSGVTCQPALA